MFILKSPSWWLFAEGADELGKKNVKKDSKYSKYSSFYEQKKIWKQEHVEIWEED